MPAVTGHLSLHLDLVTHEIKLVDAVEGKVIGREDKLIHDYRLGLQGAVLVTDLDSITAVLLPFRDIELSGHRSELIGFQLSFGDLLILGIYETDLDRLACLKDLETHILVA